MWSFGGMFVASPPPQTSLIEVGFRDALRPSDVEATTIRLMDYDPVSPLAPVQAMPTH